MRGNKNLEIYMKLTVALALALLLLYELLSGEVYYYVHPRYLYGIWFAVVALLVFALTTVGELKKGRHNSNIKRYFLYLLPIVFALLFPAMEGGNGNVAIAQSSKLQGSNLPGTNLQDSSTEEDVSAGTDESTQNSWNTSGNSSDDTSGSVLDSTGDLTSDASSSYDESEDTAEKDRSLKYKNKTEDGAILISDDEFGCWYFELFDFLKDFEGKRYQFTAQVLTMDDLKDNQLLAGRYIMTCCALDLMGYGLITESDLGGKLKENQWITVTGTIGEYKYNGNIVPMLKDVTITKTKAPKEEYVYYSYY